ncbi:hypothetical protein ASPWEDRAFT_179614 [Aspergillus wentii DTO 134E9]|uniref:Zn(2)-C6 fungal-type domain-containing protein n=1 Tax=Aspergillus wentii DTO 134E9 TaxID=1073089 RepID=A0A1L9S494_ASPWE|nr:uncharacterized protein ASPWEDRAFT_179614 [Aspergillus wentii DTO 134E9]OJJ41944.1 hypothetical protein ASPWEDRAFT_179614 [Aspergillus wentii DTO 134E9]
MSIEFPPVRTAAKDCPKCKSRRVPCDRTLPQCRKCIKRNVDCPGYGIILRWNQGVASRGKWAGKTIPQRTPIENFAHPNTLYPCHLNGLDFRLIHHFNQHIATKLAWVDGPANPWRNMILPLSFASETVLFSLLALAAEDFAHRYPADHGCFRELQAVSLGCRDKAVPLLANKLDVLLEVSDPSTPVHHHARCVLASVLLLYNLELLIAEESRWRIHIQGARAVIQWKTQAARSSAPIDKADVFLLYEYYFTAVFIGLMSFDPADEIEDDIPTDDSVTIFCDFVRIIHSVTRAERVMYTTGSQPDPTSLADIVAEIERAKTRTTQSGQAVLFKSHAAQCDFVHLVSMYYHASLIYSHRVLSTDDGASEPRIISSRASILDHLSRLVDSSTFAHDLVWPLFIAGTECRGLVAEQQTIEQALLNVMYVSGCLDRRRVLSFLKQFWRLDRDITWFEMARTVPRESKFIII